MPSDLDCQIRFTKLEMMQETQDNRLDDIEKRLDGLENNHSEQVNILSKLGLTVETLTSTVNTLNTLTSDLDKSQEVFKARFNLIIAILGVIGTAVVAAVIKLLFL